MEKKCTQCDTVKPLDQFGVSRQGARGPVYRSNCKACASARAMQWFADNPERTMANRRRWNLQKLYGITPEQYEEMLSEQGGLCAVCRQPEPDAHGRTGTQFSLSVDHCHDTGRVRGLLCQKCNRAIGLLGDNVELLRAAIRYLEKVN